MEQLKLLLDKDLTILRNTHFRSGKQVTVLLALASLLALITGAIAYGAVSWFRPLIEEMPPEFTGEIFQVLFFVVYTWLALIVFFFTVQESKNRFFLTPDLSLLVSTPVKPALIFTLRFFMFTCFNSASFLQLSIFGFAPLLALGVLASAPWHYYLLLIPVSYLYLIIPAALGLSLIMLLMRVLSPRRIFQLAGFLNLALGALWFTFVLGDQERILNRLVALFDNTGFSLAYTPLGAVGNYWGAVLGGGGGWPEPLVILIAWSSAVVLIAMLVISRVYYYNYERLQVAETIRRIKKKEKPDNGRRQRGSFFRSLLAFTVLNHWKMAFRNKEMAQGAYGIIMLLIGYVVVMGRLIDHAAPLIPLVNVAVVSFFAITLVYMLFLPFSMITDRQVLQRQFWLLKSAPIGAGKVSTSLVLANAIPAVPVGLLILVPANYFTGATAALALLSPVLLVLAIISTASVNQLAALAEAGDIGEEVPLLVKVIRELVPILAIAVTLLPVLAALYYRQLHFLSFLHSLPEHGVMAIAIALTAIISLAISRESFLRMRRAWDSMEIK